MRADNRTLVMGQLLCFRDHKLDKIAADIKEKPLSNENFIKAIARLTEMKGEVERRGEVGQLDYMINRCKSIK